MWSLGCILGEMLVGKPLFPGTSTVNQIERIMAALPRPSSDGITIINIVSVPLKANIENLKNFGSLFCYLESNKVIF